MKPESKIKRRRFIADSEDRERMPFGTFVSDGIRFITECGCDRSEQPAENQPPANWGERLTDNEWAETMPPPIGGLALHSF